MIFYLAYWMLLLNEIYSKILKTFFKFRNFDFVVTIFRFKVDIFWYKYFLWTLATLKVAISRHLFSAENQLLYHET